MRWLKRFRPEGFAPRSMLPIPSRCPKTTRCGAARTCSSRRTSARSSPQFARNALRVAAAELRRYMNGEPLHNVVQAAV